MTRFLCFLLPHCDYFDILPNTSYIMLLHTHVTTVETGIAWTLKPHCMLPENDSLVNQYAGLSSATDPGSGAFLTPGSWIGFFRNLDLGSRILNHILLTNFWVKSSILLNTKRTFKNSCEGVNREDGEFILATAVFRQPEPFRQFLFTAKCSDIVKNKHSSNFFYLDLLTLSGTGNS